VSGVLGRCAQFLKLTPGFILVISLIKLTLKTYYVDEIEALRDFGRYTYKMKVLLIIFLSN
jgi:hypothetical protein